MQVDQQSSKKVEKGNADLWFKGVIRFILAIIFFGAPVFLGAGTLAWDRGWILISLLAVSMLANFVAVVRNDPNMLRERWKLRSDFKGFDKVFAVVYLIASIGMFTLSGVDVVRFQWSSMPWSLVAVGVSLHFIGLVPTWWATVANPHLEKAVRIQKDRDHRVITDGPYRFVRHPMYIGIITMFYGWPLILGSWIGLAFSTFIMFLFLIRTALEDRTLQLELEGYSEFAQRTRYRLIPGLW